MMRSKKDRFFKSRILIISVTLISLFLLGCSSSLSLEGVPSKDQALVGELVDTIKNFDSAAQSGDVTGVEELMDPSRLALHKRLLAKSGQAWDSSMVKNIRWMKDISDNKVLGVTTKDIWARLEMLSEFTNGIKDRSLQTIVFYKLGDKWKIYNNTSFELKNELTESPDSFIKKSAHTEAFIPPLTEVGESAYNRMPFDLLLAATKNKDNSLNGNYVETQGIVNIRTVGTDYFLDLRSNGGDLMSNVNLIIREEYISDLDKIAAKCNGQCNAIVRGVFSDTGIYLTKLEVK